jgi:hypothetical protein
MFRDTAASWAVGGTVFETAVTGEIDTDDGTPFHIKEKNLFALAEVI